MRVDPQGKTDRAEAGVTWGEFDRETQAFGLATTGGLASTTGIAGLTLGGGLGWLMGSYGLACDNLISVDVITSAIGKQVDVLTAKSTREIDAAFLGLSQRPADALVVTRSPPCSLIGDICDGSRQRLSIADMTLQLGQG